METPPRVCSFESRRNGEMGSLIERQGGIATVVPSMQEVPLDDNAIAIAFADRLDSGAIDVVVFMTGVGARTLAATMDGQSRFEAFVAQLNRRDVVARGPKPAAVLREWAVDRFHLVEQPNTWRELVNLFDTGGLSVDGKTVAVQEYGVPNQDLYDAIAARGGTVFPVPVYRWKLPDDTTQLADTVRQVIAGDFDVLLFTSANQARNVLAVAETLGLRLALLNASNSCCVGSIGPTCSEALVAEGFNIGYEASPPKMGQLVRGALEVYRGV